MYAVCVCAHARVCKYGVCVCAECAYFIWAYMCVWCCHVSVSCCVHVRVVWEEIDSCRVGDCDACFFYGSL